jgi:hypothetical protein
MATFKDGDIIHGTGAGIIGSKLRATALISQSRRNCLIQSGFGC